MTNKYKINKFIANIFQHIIYENKKFFFTDFVKIPTLGLSKKKSEIFFAKTCWKGVSKFQKKISIWKIINNQSSLEGLKQKKDMKNQKKKLKFLILRQK